uniref:Uncharacterized protein n=1 Tax=Arundo donax TaxID=35708 RepID=A0A0A9DIH3_ARUDO
MGSVNLIFGPCMLVAFFYAQRHLCSICTSPTVEEGKPIFPPSYKYKAQTLPTTE